MAKQGFTTKILHTPFSRKDANGALRMPVYDCAAFEFEDSEMIEKAFKGQLPMHVYTRSSNPTVEYFESVVRNITESLGVVSLSSGMAAISNTVLALAESGCNFVVSNHLFGNTHALYTKTFVPFGVEFKLADFSDLKDVESKIDDKTVALFFETITNPHLEVADVKALSSIAKKHKVVLLADTTMSPPYLFNAKEHGVDIELVSSTKFMSGGATSIGGLIIDYGTYDWSLIPKLKSFSESFGQQAFIAKLRKDVYRNLGACLSPHSASLQTLGLETLPLRADRACGNALAVAEALEKHPKVVKVNYPSLKSSAFYEISQKQFGGKAGAVVSFELESQDACYKMMDALQYCRRATNLNDNKTLIIHPSSTIYAEFNMEEQAAMGIPPTLIRLAVGIEDVQDIIDDLYKGLELI